MPNKLPLFLVACAMLFWAPESEVGAKQHVGCEEGTLIYWHDQHTWICEPGEDAGQACILCYGEPIDVVG